MSSGDGNQERWHSTDHHSPTPDIYEKCVLGFLKHRTRVLVTHSVALTLPKSHHVVVVEGGRVVAEGPPDSGDPAISRLRKRTLSSTNLAAMGSPDGAPNGMSGASASKTAANTAGGAAPPTLERAGSSQASHTSQASATTDPGSDAGTASGATAARAGAITGKEERARGAAKAGTYLSYLKAAGGLKFNLFFFMMLLSYSGEWERIEIRNGKQRRVLG